MRLCRRRHPGPAAARQHVGYSVAVANAVAEVREYCDYVTERSRRFRRRSRSLRDSSWQRREADPHERTRGSMVIVVLSRRRSAAGTSPAITAPTRNGNGDGPTTFGSGRGYYLRPARILGTGPKTAAAVRDRSRRRTDADETPESSLPTCTDQLLTGQAMCPGSLMLTRRRLRANSVRSSLS